MLTYDPIPWLMAQEGLETVRARWLLGLHCEGDEQATDVLEHKLVKGQLADGSFDHSLMKTAGVLNLLVDLRAAGCKQLTARASTYLISILQSQPGYERAKSVKPGSLRTPCDQCGFFGPYDDRNVPKVMAGGAREMNFYRRFEPLLGPKSTVRGVHRSSLDRPGPGSCFASALLHHRSPLPGRLRPGSAS